jgi:hypothetical protein
MPLAIRLKFYAGLKCSREKRKGGTRNQSAKRPPETGIVAGYDMENVRITDGYLTM